MRRRTGLVLVSLLAAVAAMAAQQLPPGTFRIGEAPDEYRAAISRADLVIVSLHDSLLRELSGALAHRNPGAALTSCHVDIAGAIQQLEHREGITAGRTSDRLRNARNAPPRWAAPLVTEFAGRPARDVPGFVVDLPGRIGVLRPIAEQPLCASCHGPTTARPDSVQAALAKRYPEDRAIGFREGEVRGWYWVEMEKESNRKW